MTNADVVGPPATVHARNVGGISETEVDVPPGVTVLAGRNATNRTSLLQAIMAAMGSRLLPRTHGCSPTGTPW